MADNQSLRRLQFDFLAVDPNGKIQLAIESKGKRGTSEQWATAFRRNLLAHKGQGKADFFLLAALDKFYLWDERLSPSPDTPPHYTIDSEPILKQFLQSMGDSLETARGEAFELILQAWLSDLFRRIASGTPLPEELNWLSESGLLHHLQDVHLEREAA